MLDVFSLQDHAELQTVELSKERLTEVDIDDGAFRRNHRCGTIVCHLERRRIVTLLPDPEIATSAAWLADHPAIRILSRDRGGDFGAAATRALLDAIKVELLLRMSSDLACMLPWLRSRPARVNVGCVFIPDRSSYKY